MHYSMALMQGSCSIISLFRAPGLFLYQNPPVAQPLSAIMSTDRKPGTGYSIIQDVALFRNKPSYQVVAIDK